MTSPPKLSDALERDLTLVHSDVCRCSTDGSVFPDCDDIRNILRREIAAAMEEKEADCWESHGNDHEAGLKRHRAMLIRRGDDA